jgi:hypothetical protein
MAERSRNDQARTADAMPGWEPAEKPVPDAYDSGRPLSKPDRVAREQRELVDKYRAIASSPASDNPSPASGGSDAPPQHAELRRLKKRGALDNDVNAKTFVYSDGKPSGAQG